MKQLLKTTEPLIPFNTFLHFEISFLSLHLRIVANHDISLILNRIFGGGVIVGGVGGLMQ